MSYDILPKAKLQYLLTRLKEVFDGIEITDVGVPSTASVGQVPTVRNVGGSNVFVMETPQGVTRLQSLDMVGKTTTFNADGSISVVADDYSEDITFNANGTITDEVTINGVTTTKTITFSGSQITEVIS